MSTVQPALRLAAGVDAREHVRAWLAAPELGELVDAQGARPPHHEGDPAAELADLDVFSDRWDLGGGRERNEAGARQLDERQIELVLRAARALGQLDHRLPDGREWDHVVVLGGLLRACVARPLLAARWLAEGAVQTDSVVALGSLRQVNDGERELAGRVEDLVDPRATLADELDALTVGVRRAFDLPGVFDEVAERHASPETSWVQRLYRDPGGPSLTLLAAPAPRPGWRATTGEALSWWGDRAALAPGTRVLLVTTEIYRHYHLVEGVRTLGLRRSAVVDCVGMSPDQADPRLAHEFGASSRLQELRSSIRALRALVADLGPTR